MSDECKRTVFLCKNVGGSDCGVALAQATKATVVYGKKVEDGVVYAIQHAGVRHGTIDRVVAKMDGFVDGLSQMHSTKVLSYGGVVEEKRSCAYYQVIYNIEKRCGNGFSPRAEVAQYTQESVVKYEDVQKKRAREEGVSDVKTNSDEIKWLLGQKLVYSNGSFTRWFCACCQGHGSLEKLAACQCRRMEPWVECHCGFRGNMTTDMDAINEHTYEVCKFIKDSTYSVAQTKDERMILAVVQRAKNGWWAQAKPAMYDESMDMGTRLMYAANAWKYALPTPPWPFGHLGPAPSKWARCEMDSVPEALVGFWQTLAEFGKGE
jgi:hypothetical protein